MSKDEILHAYRKLMRTSLQAVQYSKPARFAVRDIINEAFREQPASAFNAFRIKNTIGFLETAKQHTGYEYKIVKNLTMVKYWQKMNRDKTMLTNANNDYTRDIRLQTRLQFSATLTMLNESLGTCLTI